MKRLTETDKYGNWGLREIPWKNLYTGTPITWETYEALYGALCKLKDYEDSGLSPADVEELRRQQDSHHWIPVEERLPEEEILVWVTVKHSSWISDYGSDFIPKEEWGYHPESSGTYKGKYEEGIWWYEDEVNEWIRCDGEPNEARDPGVVYDTVIAWQPILEPYKGGRMKPDLYHNASGVRDPVAAKAIREADRQPEHVSKAVELMKFTAGTWTARWLAGLC